MPSSEEQSEPVCDSSVPAGAVDEISESAKMQPIEQEQLATPASAAKDSGKSSAKAAAKRKKKTPTSKDSIFKPGESDSDSDGTPSAKRRKTPPASGLRTPSSRPKRTPAASKKNQSNLTKQTNQLVTPATPGTALLSDNIEPKPTETQSINGKSALLTPASLEQKEKSLPPVASADEQDSPSTSRKANKTTAKETEEAAYSPSEAEPSDEDDHFDDIEDITSNQDEKDGLAIQRSTLELTKRPSASYKSGDTESETGPDSAKDLEPRPKLVQRDFGLHGIKRAGHVQLARRKERREEEFADLTDQEYYLFSILDRRGFESFLPITWHIDFAFGSPDYYADTPELTHIRPLKFSDSNANFRAMSAFKALTTVGPRARDMVQVSQQSPEIFITRKIRDYRQWAKDDALVYIAHTPSLLSVVFEGPDDGAGGTKDTLKKLEERMQKNADMWRSWSNWHAADSVREERVIDDHQVKAEEGPVEVETAAHSELSRSSWLSGLKDKIFGDSPPKQRAKKEEEEEHAPVPALNTDKDTDNKNNDDKCPVEAVYGIAVNHLVVTILSLPIEPRASLAAAHKYPSASSPDKRQKAARVLFYMDFSKPSEDIWNSVAVAMAVCHCRDMQVRAIDWLQDQADERQLEQAD